MANVQDMIASDGYKNKKPYVARSKDKDAWEAYNVESSEIYERFKQDLFETYGVDHLPPKVLDKAFSIAWDQGHSSGYNEVVLYFSDLADLMKLMAEEV